MEIKTYPFQKLPFSDLFKDYSQQKKSVLKFFETPPFNRGLLVDRAESFQFKGDRFETSKILKSFNKDFRAGKKTLENIDRLKKDDTLVVVTGQQMTLFGGPLYTIYKTITAITAANEYEKLLKRPVVPVFWLADEDHDADEISEIGLFDNDKLRICSVEFENREIRSGELPLEDVIQELKKCTKECLFETDFSKDLWHLLDDCYNTSSNVSKSFGSLLLKLFGNYGLVLAGSNLDAVKHNTVDVLTQSVKKRHEIYDALQRTTQSLTDEGYHGQVHLNQSNLFYITDENHRTKLLYSDNTWTVDQTGDIWTTDELIERIVKEPNRFSPNVFLRPILQDRFLPVISYVAGPGEVAYYAQMKHMYKLFDQNMPQVLPRFSVTIVESSIKRIFKKLPFSIQDYHQRIEDLEARYIEQADKPDIESIFEDWKKRVDELTQEKKKEIGEIDPTLENSVGKASATYFSELDKLKGKIYRSIKQQEKTQIDRISRIKSNLYPDGNLQERKIAFIYFLNKYGLDLFDKVLVDLKEKQSDSHKLIYL